MQNSQNVAIDNPLSFYHTRFQMSTYISTPKSRTKCAWISRTDAPAEKATASGNDAVVFGKGGVRDPTGMARMQSDACLLWPKQEEAGEYVEEAGRGGVDSNRSTPVPGERGRSGAKRQRISSAE